MLRICCGKMNNDYFFSYKSGNSFLHRVPSFLKLLFIPVINVLFFYLPVQFTVFFIIIQFITALILRFSFSEIFTDLKPVIYYALLLICARILPQLFAKNFYIWKNLSWAQEKQTVFLLIKIMCVMQSASLVFKTSTPLELRHGIEVIETFIRKIFCLKKKNNFTNLIFLFLNFIPMVSKIWNSTKKAWIIRNGKQGIKMYLVLLPVLFSCSLKKAYNLSRALAIRDS